jgi:hypothetical protein
MPSYKVQDLAVSSEFSHSGGHELRSAGSSPICSFPCTSSNFSPADGATYPRRGGGGAGGEGKQNPRLGHLYSQRRVPANSGLGARRAGVEPPGKRGGHATLRGMTSGKLLSCAVLDIDRYGRLVAQCFLPDGRDIAVEMIHSGAATEYCRYSCGFYRSC